MRCAVCLEPLILGEAASPPCGHHFHEACVMQWSKKDNSCPECKERFQSLRVPRGTSYNILPVADRWLEDSLVHTEPVLDADIQRAVIKTKKTLEQHRVLKSCQRKLVPAKKAKEVIEQSLERRSALRDSKTVIWPRIEKKAPQAFGNFKLTPSYKTDAFFSSK